MSFVIPECLGSVILLFFYHSVIDGTPKIKAVKKKTAYSLGVRSIKSVLR